MKRKREDLSCFGKLRKHRGSGQKKKHIRKEFSIGEFQLTGFQHSVHFSRRIILNHSSLHPTFKLTSDAFHYVNMKKLSQSDVFSFFLHKFTLFIQLLPQSYRCCVFESVCFFSHPITCLCKKNTYVSKVKFNFENIFF